MKYLDPKADLTFKKVFGEHPDLVRDADDMVACIHEPCPVQCFEGIRKAAWQWQ